MPTSQHNGSYAAVFMDFENIYYFLKSALGSPADASDHVVNMIREIKKHLAETRSEECIVMHAYADFERIETSPQGPLYLAGVETHNVLGTEHKNAADMKLCIDALDTMYVRREIATFVLVAGDRDYIPVIQHLKKHAKTVLAIGFAGNMSGDLLQNVGEESFLDASGFLPATVRDQIRRYEQHRTEELRAKSTTPAQPKAPTPNGATVKPQVLTFSHVMPLKNEQEIDALDILLRDFGHHSEVWVSPFLNTLRKEFASLAEFERKALISSLAAAGAVRVEQREGEPYPYSVLVVNWNHPDVRDRNPG